ncbi:MFS transporter [Paenibacillus glycanilyticus]|uniref:MFS transporter n=1 Tax=Paenibacillus glycanilyticus TaxID=126569 RepID=A0ABQ6GC05_9BACL|nr:MFS transporter [Paenibacillus glycanilyticus]GLX67187.1 MFS transporter [Paenibacillus glycanilyticus]
MLREKIWTRNFVTICVSSFFMFLTFYVLTTAFPLYVRDSLHGNQQQMGLVITIYVLGGVLIRPFSGQWVDRFGKRKMAIIGMVIFLIACLSYFGTKGIILFLIVRFIHGMSYAVASTAMSTVAATIVPTSRQGEGMGYYTMFMSIAMVVGPALGLFLWQDKNINVLLLAICVIAAASLVFAALLRMPGEKRSKETAVAIAAEAEQPEPAVTVTSAAKSSVLSRFVEPAALPISLVGFILSFAYSSLSSFMASFTDEIHQSQVTGTFFMVFAVMIVAFRPLIGKIFDRYKEHYLYYPGVGLFAVGMFLLSQAHSAAMVLFAGVIMGIGYGALLPCFQTLAIKLSPEHRRGSANGTFFLMFDLGYGLGSYFMGMVASFTDYRMMYFVAGIVTLVCAGGYYLLHHRPRARLLVGSQKANAA